jgi:hypothetical protein
MYYRGAAQWIVKHRPTAVDAPDEEWVPAKTLVNEDLHAIRTAKDLGRFCKKQTVPTRPAKTKDGREHKQRLEVHKPSFDAAMREFRRTTRSLADFADRQLTEDERRAEQK